MTHTMHTRTRRTVAAVAGATLGAGLLIASAPAANASGVEVHKRGTCTMGSTWQLELDKEHGFIDVDFEAETLKAGQRWKVKIKHTRVKNNKKWTYRSNGITDRDGELDVDRHLKDRKGKDRVAIRVMNPSTGEVCRAKATI